ncbi:hypothetical protein [Telluribacter sp. SYSU D00476]|uniref:hypothetical protein n=1 Tax=Telluribacter sp. SYSU D00476 TaxID=2811430 RepID=UPI001FF25E32|nr:hypothetical protein [Telluribacter sp. SYSU D00476]
MNTFTKTLVKIGLSGIVLLIALSPYIDSSDKSGALDMISTVGTAGISLLAIAFFIAVAYYCIALETCLSLISKGNRKARPKSVWYMFLLPYNFIEDFFIIINISNSIEAEANRNIKLLAMKDYGMITGMGWCIAQLLSLAPNIAGQVGGALGLVLWVLHWRFINKVNMILAAK